MFNLEPDQLRACTESKRNLSIWRDFISRYVRRTSEYFFESPDSKLFPSEEIKNVCSQRLCSRHFVHVGNMWFFLILQNKGYVSIAHVV